MGDGEAVQIAKELKYVASPKFKTKSLESFYEKTKKLFIYNLHEGGVDIAEKTNLAKAVGFTNFELEFFIPSMQKMAGLQLNPCQEVFLIYAEWCSLDMVWEDERSRYRILWHTNQ